MSSSPHDFTTRRGAGQGWPALRHPRSPITVGTRDVAFPLVGGRYPWLPVVRRSYARSRWHPRVPRLPHLRRLVRGMDLSRLPRRPVSPALPDRGGLDGRARSEASRKIDGGWSLVASAGRCVTLAFVAAIAACSK